jgi:hypothetical protein
VLIGVGLTVGTAGFGLEAVTVISAVAEGGLPALVAGGSAPTLSTGGAMILGGGLSAAKGEQMLSAPNAKHHLAPKNKICKTKRCKG